MAVFVLLRVFIFKLSTVLVIVETNGKKKALQKLQPGLRVFNSVFSLIRLAQTRIQGCFVFLLRNKF